MHTYYYIEKKESEARDKSDSRSKIENVFLKAISI